MSDDVFVLPGDEPTLWAYPSQVHPGGTDTPVTIDATGSGTASLTLAVTLARTATGDATPTVARAADLGRIITADGAGVAAATRAVDLQLDATGDGVPEVVAGHGYFVTVDATGSAVIDVGVQFIPAPPPTSGAGGTRREPSRIHHEPEVCDPEDPTCRDEDDVLALILLGAL